MSQGRRIPDLQIDKCDESFKFWNNPSFQFLLSKGGYPKYWFRSMIRSKTRRFLTLLTLLMITIPTMFQPGVASSHDECEPSRCRIEGPEIKFPFMKPEQPRHCGYPGFQVSCAANGDTLIHLPSYSQPLNISYISYQGYEMLSIPHQCPMDVLFHLNFSSALLNFSHILCPDYRQFPPPYESSLVEITKIKCSSRITGYDGLFEVSCLSQGSDDHVYVATTNDVEWTWAMLPSSCRRGESIRIPTQCNHISDLEFLVPFREIMLSFTWVLPGCGGCTLRGGTCQFANNTGDRTICKQNTGTTNSYPPPPLHDKKGAIPTKYVILGVILGIVLIALAMGIAYKVRRHKRSTDERLEKQKKVDKFLEDYKSLKPTRYTYADIKHMTKHWKTKLGEGGYGSVYKGELPNQTPMAVKVLKISTDDGGDFINEVGTMGRIHHINVVRLLGFCADGVHQALVYEFMPNGSLDKFIFSREGRDKLGTWECLLDIAIGIAQGIEYLHQGCDQHILHFDIKPSNILLDQNLEPKISDFGQAKMYSKDASVVSVSAVRGTIGYIAPEILSGYSQKVSSKSDVYSYGMLLLEMVSGRKNIFEGDARNSGQVNYPEYLYTCLKNGQEMQLDASMEGEGEIAKKLIMVAMWCIQWFPVNRPSIKIVIKMTQGSIDTLEIPPNPFVAYDTKENEAHVISLDPILE